MDFSFFIHRFFKENLRKFILEWGLLYGHMELYARPKKQQTYFGGRYGPITNCLIKKLFHNFFLMFAKKFKIDFLNKKWNFMNRKWKYSFHFNASDQTPSIQNCLSIPKQQMEWAKKEIKMFSSNLVKFQKSLENSARI